VGKDAAPQGSAVHEARPKIGLEQGLIYLLDTNAISAVGKQSKGYELIFSRVSDALQARHTVGLSMLTVYEVRRGLIAGELGPRRRISMGLALGAFRCYDFDGHAAESAAKVWAELERTGQHIGDIDELIAGHAMALGATLVTHNVRHFKRVAGLKFEDWSV
jgi:tRNA(fMet)-specific endonuclease VapC